MVNRSNDLYKILGVDPNASDDEIRSAFRERAKGLHPDVNPEDPSSEEAFKRLSSAFSTLSKPEERRLYDLLRPPSDRHHRTAAEAGRPAKIFFRKFAYGGLAGLAAAGTVMAVIVGLNDQAAPDFLQFANAVWQDLSDSGASRRTTAALKTKASTTGAASTENTITRTDRHQAIAKIFKSREQSKASPKAEPQRPAAVEIANEITADNPNTDLAKTQTAAKPKVASVSAVKSPPKAEGTPKKRQAVATKQEAKPKQRRKPRAKRSKRRAIPQKKNAQNLLRRAVRAAISKQLAAFRKNDGAAAFALAAPNVQERFRGPRSFMKMVAKDYPQVYRPKKIVFLSLIKKRRNIVQRVLLRGTDRRSVIARYSLVRVNGRWRISGCELLPPGQRI